MKRTTPVRITTNLVEYQGTSYIAGDQVDVPAKLAEQMIEAGVAEPTKPDARRVG